MARNKTGSRTSKRVSCKKRYKIEKKVKEHLKKVKKRQEKTIKKGIRGIKKEITVPNRCPFKEDILKNVKDAKERLEEERQKKRETQKSNREKLVNKHRSIESMVDDADKKMEAFERKNAFIKESAQKLDKINVESSLRTFYKEVKNVIDRSDVVIEVLDARDPLGSRCKQLEETVILCGKKLILLLNKIDLVPKENVEAWLKYLRKELPALPFKACTQQQSDRLGSMKMSAMTSNENVKKSSSCLGWDMLLSLLGNYCRNMDIKTSITIGIVGFPNTGKSSIINSLKRSKACNVGSTPGVTKSMQVVQIDKNIKLIDSPGVVMASNLHSREEVILKNCVKLENLEDVMPVVSLIMSKCSKWQLMAIYNLQEFNDIDHFLELISKRFGFLKKGGRPDLNKAAKNIIRDWNSGKITYYSKPPEDSSASSHISVEIVKVMKEAFNIDALFNTEETIMNGLTREGKSTDSVMVSGGIADGEMQSVENEGEGGMKEDEVEKMEDETEAAAEIVVESNERISKKKEGKDVQKKVTFEDQLEENQQLGRARKQEFKKMLKKRKRSEKISDSLGAAMEGSLKMNVSEEDKYVFDEHF